MSEGLADGGHVSRQRHRVLVAVADADVADHHQRTGNNLCGLVPFLVLERLLGRDGELHPYGTVGLVEDLYPVVVDLAPLEFNGMTVLVLTRDDDALGLLVVADGHRRVGLDGYFALKAFLVLGQVLFVFVVLLVLFVLLLSVIRFLSAES